MTAIIEERLAKLNELVLEHGAHETFEQGACAMEAVAWLAGEPHSDAPQCACPVITRAPEIVDRETALKAREIAAAAYAHAAAYAAAAAAAKPIYQLAAQMIERMCEVKDEAMEGKRG